MSLTQPIGQKRLTNIAVVRFKKGGHRFEIACYKNKVLSWRQGVAARTCGDGDNGLNSCLLRPLSYGLSVTRISPSRSEKDINEVLQTTTVFTNVSKGVVASAAELKAAFGPAADAAAACREILDRGELQVSDKERAAVLAGRFRDVATVLADKCVNPGTGRPYPVGLIERGLRDIHFAADPGRSAKQQALEALPLLAARFPIARASMRLRVTLPRAAVPALLAVLHDQGGVVEGGGGDRGGDVGGAGPADDAVCREMGGGASGPGIGEGETNDSGRLVTITCRVGPSAFRPINAFLAEQVGGAGTLEVAALAVHGDTDGGTNGGTDGDTDGGTNVVGAGGWGEKGADGEGHAPLPPDLTESAAAAPTMTAPVSSPAPTAPTRGGLRCGACDVRFESCADHGKHHKSDWHRVNLRRRVAGEGAIGEAEHAAEAAMGARGGGGRGRDDGF